MTEEAALLAAIVAHPADDTPRLVYADWLDEHGRPEQAMFIRTQCQFAAVTPDHPNYTDLLDREAELQLWLATHAPGPNLRLSAGLKVSGGPTWWKSSLRGFPRFFEFDAHPDQPPRAMRDLAAALEKVFTRLPTRWLIVNYLSLPQLAELLRQPALAALDHIALYGLVSEEVEDEAARLVAESPHLQNLRGLILGMAPGEAGCEALARSANFVQLGWFSLDPDRLTGTAVRTLTQADWFRGLATLELPVRASGEAFETLCRTGPFPRLHSLELPAAHELRVWEVFARSNAFPRLTALRSFNGDLSGGRMAALAAATQFRLHTLDLVGCAIGNDGAEALAAAPWAGSLRRLILGNNSLGPGGVAAIGGGPFGNLGHLDLDGNSPGVGGLRAITKNPALRRLTSLSLGYPSPGDRTTAAHIEEFLTRLDLPDLRRLELDGLPVGVGGAKVLATDPKYRSLTRLVLDSCRIGDPGASALIRSPHLQELIELQISENDIRSGVEPLADLRVMPRLAACRLDGNPIPAKLAARLKRRRGVQF